MSASKPVKVNIKDIKLSPNNPRLVKDNKFKQLVKSIQDFPEMLELRPIVVDEHNVILGGNMRYRAVQEAGIKEVYIIKALGLTEEKKKEFVIKDNVSYGEWDWDIIANEWDTMTLQDWGLDVFMKPDEVDLSVLDDEEPQQDLAAMASEAKKALQIEFMVTDYDNAAELVAWCRKANIYVGGLLIEKLKEVKERNV